MTTLETRLGVPQQKDKHFKMTSRVVDSKSIETILNLLPENVVKALKGIADQLQKDMQVGGDTGYGPITMTNIPEYRTDDPENPTLGKGNVSSSLAPNAQSQQTSTIGDDGIDVVYQLETVENPTPNSKEAIREQMKGQPEKVIQEAIRKVKNQPNPPRESN